MKQNLTDLTVATTVLDRREFFVTSILTGAFALAVQPIAAQTRIMTDSAGLIAGEVKIPVADGEIPAYRAMPDGKNKKFPVVLVVHEIFGVHEWVQDICRRLAKKGYMAIAPSLYARQGDVLKMTNIGEIIGKVVSKVPDAQVMSDMDAAVAYAKKSGSGNAKKLAITGFCWGGRVVWLYSAHNRKVDAGAAWYGGLVATERSPKNPLQPTFPVDIAKDLRVPVIGFYGGLDTGIPQDTVRRMREELRKGKSKSEIIVYPYAEHGFNADYRKSYNPQAANDAWEKMLVWFEESGAA
ncbi:MAG: dienelactone hydrolase family protein [Acidobacteria bacterium]|jgi:carboxymethylenebutenolidase|nr:dienelactone hydrolase family protein [Acidobacteriota bacterium]